MQDAVTEHRLVVVDPDARRQGLSALLHEAGWTVSTRPVFAPCADVPVGVFCLNATQAAPLPKLAAWLVETGALWLALAEPEELQVEPVVESVLGTFADIRLMPLEEGALVGALERLQARTTLSPVQELVGQSRPLEELRRLVERLAASEAPVLIRGEPGTGKRAVAHCLHRQSLRTTRPLISLDCDAFEPERLHAELFGDAREPGESAGRVKAAAGGTLLISNIDLLSLETQASLLEVLHRGELGSTGAGLPLDIRMLATSHADLETLVRNRQFREDLYYRINVLQVNTPPLRERKSDLAPLANRFVQRFCDDTGRSPRSFSRGALSAMEHHEWPGNLRELQGRIYRALLLGGEHTLDAIDLGLINDERNRDHIGTLKDYVFRAERQALCDVLAFHSDNLSQAAKVLGISRPTFYRLLHKHQIR